MESTQVEPIPDADDTTCPMVTAGPAGAYDGLNRKQRRHAQAHERRALAKRKRSV